MRGHEKGCNGRPRFLHRSHARVRVWGTRATRVCSQRRSHACGDWRGSRCVEHHQANNTIKHVVIWPTTISPMRVLSALAAGLKARHVMRFLEALTHVFLAIGRVSPSDSLFLVSEDLRGVDVFMCASSSAWCEVLLLFAAVRRDVKITNL